MVGPSTTFETGVAYRCVEDTHLIDYKLTKRKKKSSYGLIRRAIRIRKGDIILCIRAAEDKDGQQYVVFTVGDEIVHTFEQFSTLKALRKSLIRI